MNKHHQEAAYAAIQAKPVNLTAFGGSKPYDSASPDSGRDGCGGDLVCVKDISAQQIQSYWQANKAFLDVAGALTILGGLTSVVSLAAAQLPKVLSAAGIALFAGVVDPEPVSKAFLVAGAVAAVTVLGISVAALDMQKVNDAIVKSGAYNNGGSISAGWNSVTITSGGSRTSVHTWLPFDAAISLNNWAASNPALSPIPSQP